ncbi:hypothetical protein BGW37DRAFT_524296 [Umbelopsis sp. PMI_123]|nr:hypothetical protein BGW37DRAFT_524296 [Umbelopsis sp. PMI_123]
MSSSMRQTVTLQLSCHICQKSGYYGGNLRKHLKTHGITIKEKRGNRFRRCDNEQYIYTNAKDENAVVHNECIACEYHCADIFDLRAHINQTHTVLEVDKTDSLGSDDVDEPEPDDAEELIAEDEESINNITIEKIETLTKAYSRMREEQKWRLSTGKCVEDELYKFAGQCTYEHPSLSFIVDPYDATYKQQGIFTESELQEIKDYNPVVMESLPQDLVDYLMLFDCRTTEEFLKACFENQHGTILSTGPNISIMIGFEGQIAEFEAGCLKVQHHENWYMVRIWSLIDRLFADIEDLEAVRGESGSIATAMRKNQDRVIPSMIKMKRKAMGRRGDRILSKGSVEYGCVEAGARDEGQWGTKKLLETGVKAAKILKDMLTHLADLVGNDESTVRQLRTIGYIHSGMHLMLMKISMKYSF